jgi:predicted MFS family arabinose efflux permease
LLVVESWGQPRTLVACACIVLSAGIGAFVLRAPATGSDARDADAPDASATSPAHVDAPTADSPAAHATSAAPAIRALSLLPMLRHAFGRETWPIIALAATFKLGPHIASALIKPMLVDAHWTSREVGVAAVTIGTTFALVGAAIGGWIYRVLRDRRALYFAAVLQALACAPLAIASLTGVPHFLATAAIAIEHLASGIGTTVLFAALMTATRPSSAALHYTVLTSTNAVALGLGGLLGGILADRLGEANAYIIAIFVSLAPLLLLPRWDAAASASSAEPVTAA